MKKSQILTNSIEIENLINSCLDLTEIAKTYCEFYYDKANETSALISLLEVVLNNQKVIKTKLDQLLINC